MQAKLQLRIKILLLIGVVLFIPQVYADTTPVNGFMDEILRKLTNNNAVYTNIFIPAAKTLYATLVTIEIAFDTGIRMLKDGGPMKIIGILLVRIIMLLFWFNILEHPDWIQTIVDQAVALTSKVGGASNQITPSHIAGLGIQYFDSFMAKIRATNFDMTQMNNFVFSLVTILTGLSIVVLFTIIGIIFFIAKVETTMVLSIAVILLGFLGSSWTSQWGKSYIAHVIAVSLKLAVMMIMIGIIPDVTESWPNKIASAGDDFGTLLNVAVYIALCAMVLCFLTMSIPSLIASMITGVNTVSITGGFTSGGTVAASGGAISAGVSAFANGARNNLNNIGGGAHGESIAGNNSYNSPIEHMAPINNNLPSPTNQNTNSQGTTEYTSSSYQDLQKTDGNTTVPPPR